MRVHNHVISSVCAGWAVWFFTRSLYAGIICVLVGIFIDIDHVLDYMLHFGWRDFSIKKLFHVCQQTREKKVEIGFDRFYVFLHAHELLVFLWFIAIYTQNIYFLSAVIGYTLHLTLDCLGNSRHPCMYFLSYRIAKKFDIRVLFRKE